MSKQHNQLRAITVGFEQAASGIPNVAYSSYDSILGFDVVFIDLDNATEEFPDTQEASTWSLDADNSDKWWRSMHLRKSEFEELLSNGIPVVVLNSGALEIQVRQEGDYGSSPAKPIIEATISQALTQEVTFDSRRGENVDCCGQVEYQRFAEAMSGRLIFRGSLVSETGFPTFKIRSSRNVVGATFPVSNSRIVILPMYKSENDIDEYVNAALDLVASLSAKKSPDLVPTPSYIEKYQSPSESAFIAQRKALEKRSAEIAYELSEIDNALGAEYRRKRLFFSTGAPLEEAVREAFSLLGCAATAGKPGRTDLVIEHQGQIGVIEIKGVTKSAAESHAAQLEKWSSDYLIDHGVEPKPILIANTWIEIDPLERKDDFPDQMMEYCERRKHALLTGLQLYCCIADCAGDREKSTAVLDEIFATVGRFKRYQDAAVFISQTETVKN